MWNLHLTTTGRVIPSDAEDMLKPCVSISALRQWRGLDDDTPDSSSAAVVDYNDNYNCRDGENHNDIEGEGHGRIVVGLSRISRIYLGERLLCDAASSYDLCPPRGFLSYVTLGSRCTLRSVPISVLASHAECGSYNDHHHHPAGVQDKDDALLLMGEGYEP